MPDNYQNHDNNDEYDNNGSSGKRQRNSSQRERGTAQGRANRKSKNKKKSVLDNAKDLIASKFPSGKGNKNGQKTRQRSQQNYNDQRDDFNDYDDYDNSYNQNEASYRNNNRGSSRSKSKKKNPRFNAIVSLLQELWDYRKKEILLTISCVAALLVFVNVIQFFVGNNAYEVNINDKPIGILKDTSDTLADYEQIIISLVENKLINSAGANVQILDKITLTHVRSSSKDISSEESILSTLAQSLNYKVSAVQIVVDGVIKTTIESMAMADDITSKIISEYIPIDAVVVESGFAENVQKEVVYVYPNEINSYEKAFDILTDTHLVDGTYRIVSGDTASSIATRNGITKEALYQMNEGMSDETVIQVGTEINLHAEQPLLSVKIVQEITFTRTIKKTTQTIQNPDQKSSYSRVVQQGKDGEEIVTAYQTRINGYIVGADEEVSTEVVVEPVPEIIEVGV